MLYKYPQAAFPYEKLVKESKKAQSPPTRVRTFGYRHFDKDAYFDISIEYAKADQQDILIQITIENQSDVSAPITVLPTVWFRNTWCWGYDNYKHKPSLVGNEKSVIKVNHRLVGHYTLYAENADELLFVKTKPIFQRLYHSENLTKYTKDGINDYIINKKKML